MKECCSTIIVSVKNDDESNYNEKWAGKFKDLPKIFFRDSPTNGHKMWSNLLPTTTGPRSKSSGLSSSNNALTTVLLLSAY
jgi:hypothetical protein